MVQFQMTSLKSPGILYLHRVLTLLSSPVNYGDLQVQTWMSSIFFVGLSKMGLIRGQSWG